MALSFICGENRSNPEKTTDFLQVTHKIHHIVLYRVHLELTTLVVIDADYIGSHKSNYHAIRKPPNNRQTNKLR